ncbi:hypothetical protein [Acetobacter syzygii]|uniref:hypothetical protein n=1 Tax=Acetobacter syzygii TaxID=146476 RepID=UPI0039E9D44C
MHPAIEIIDTRFVAPGSQPPFDHLADQQSHGALFVGPAMVDCQDLVPTEERVTLTIDGRVAVDHIGGNSAGDPIRMLVWLASHAAHLGSLSLICDWYLNRSEPGAVSWSTRAGAAHSV